MFGVFQWTARQLCLQLTSQTSLPRAIGSPTDFMDSLLCAVGQPTIFGTLLVILQHIKIALARNKGLVKT